MHVDEVTVITAVVLCAGNEDIGDDEAADIDDVFLIPDAVFGSAGSQAASVAVNGELSHPYSHSRWEAGEGE